MARRRLRPFRVFCACAALLLFGCSAGTSPERSDQRTGTVAQPQFISSGLPAHFERLLRWGTAPDELTVRRPGHETVALGPDAVALAPGGGALLLDQLGRRVLHVGPSGKPEHVVSVPKDCVALVAGPDGALAAYSALQGTAWVFGPDGAPAGQLRVPGMFRSMLGLSMGRSRRLSVHNAEQDTIPLGSPAAPMARATSLRAIRQGAVFLDDDRGVIARVRDGQAEVAILRTALPASERDRVAVRHAIPGEVKAARLIGADGSIVCLRLEQVRVAPKTGEIEVDRRAYCLDTTTGESTFDAALPRPGLYLPSTELAMGGGRLAFIHALDEGLKLTSWRVPASPRREGVSP